MAKRNVTDTEIGLIKAMLARGMKNCDIQFYFNRQDRPVNSGRITQIRGGTYGTECAQATESELDTFLSAFRPSEVGVVVSTGVGRPPSTVADHARALFEQRGRTGWYLKTHETDATECKEAFCLKPENRFADPVRSIAGLANNRGGFVFFGVAELPDGSLNVTGLRDSTFADTDPSEINRCLAGALDPVPVFELLTLDFDGKSVGAIYVRKHDHPPVVALKNINTEVKEGSIYYRYVGETRLIKPGELRQILAYREQKAVAEFASRMSKVAAGDAATLDLDTGLVAGKKGGFLIGEDLLPKLQFIRQGEFEESTGAPTLRLIGDVTTVGSGPTRTIRSNLTDEAALLDFLVAEPVVEPMQYILHCAHTGRVWLPIFFYAKSAQRPLSDVVTALKAELATHVTSRNSAIRRLSGKGDAAFRAATGKGKEVLVGILAGKMPKEREADDVAPTANAIQGLPASAAADFKRLRAVLLDVHKLTSGSSPEVKARRSTIYRAACRIDELEFGPGANLGTKK